MGATGQTGAWVKAAVAGVALAAAAAAAAAPVDAVARAEKREAVEEQVRDCSQSTRYWP